MANGGKPGSTPVQPDRDRVQADETGGMGRGVAAPRHRRAARRSSWAGPMDGLCQVQARGEGAFHGIV